MNVGSGLINKDGPWGSFLTGVLAAVVATPCTAPFMAPAIGYALTQPPLIILIIFESLAMGLAAPFLLIGFVSSVAKALPKPGPWMDTFKQVLAFPMYGSAAWLIWVVAQQVDPVGFAATLAGFILIAFGIWLLGCMPREGRGRLLAGGSATAVFLTAIAIAVVTEARPPGKTQASMVGTNWESFSIERVQELNAAGVPVFVNFTAAWCITCLVNERVVLSTDKVRKALATKNVVYLKADWTNRNPVITAMLESFGRSGVPLYVLYDTEGTPEIQPQILTPNGFLESIEAL